MDWYFRLLGRQPYFVIIFISVIATATLVVILTCHNFPNFSDPTMGLETRGTTLANRRTTWENLLEENRPSGKLQSNPYYLFNVDKVNNQVNKNRKFRAKIKEIKDLSKINRPYIGNKPEISTMETIINYSNDSRDNYEYGKHIAYGSDVMDVKRRKVEWSEIKKIQPPTPKTKKQHTFFCAMSPSIDYSHFVVERTNKNENDSLFKLDALLSMCELEARFTDLKEYAKLCETKLSSKQCCRIWSLPNYIAHLSNKSSCMSINDNDVDNVENLLLKCYRYYENSMLFEDCDDNRCTAPVECQRDNAIYQILHYLTDIEFINLNETKVFLKSSMIFIPVARSTLTLPIYHDLNSKSLSNDVVGIVAMDMGLKNSLFDYYLLNDIYLIGIGGLFVMGCIWMYTKSLFLTIMIAIAMSFSLVLTYFIYAFILEMPIFPFMNLLAIIVLIGIGADDAFIFVKIWNSKNAECNEPFTSEANRIEKLIKYTIKHAVLAMFVTSLTTSIAFYVSIISSITAIRCFGIFAGTLVMIHYLLMITWLPAAVSISERMSSCISRDFCERPKESLSIFINKIGKFYEIFIMKAVEFCPWLWISLFTLISIISAYIVFVSPCLQLPNSQNFNLYKSNHPFELYDNFYRKRFWFEKAYVDIETYRMPLTFVWGVLPVDDGNYLDPLSKGNLYYDDLFNASSPEAQQWLLQFCNTIKLSPFYYTHKSYAIKTPNCFIENFETFMNRRCIDSMTDSNHTPCCNTSKFPYTVEVFNQCLPRVISKLYDSPINIFQPSVAGPKFFVNTEQIKINITNSTMIKKIPTKPTVTPLKNKLLEIRNISNPMTYKNNYKNKMAIKHMENEFRNRPIPILKVIVIEFESTQRYTNSYTEINLFYNTIENWFKQQLKNAPDGLKNGWFYSNFEFYDLQHTLINDTTYAFSYVVIMTFFVLLILTWNLFLSLFAILTVTFSSLTIIATLILFGWELNILESIAISSAIGLTIDFSLHYCGFYRYAPDKDHREVATHYSLKRIIGPSTMAALTTIGAGILMVPSSVLAYVEIGIFLIVTMVISWLFATFFLMSVLRVIGPQNKFGQCDFSRGRTDNNNAINHLNEVNNNRLLSDHVSEQLLSASTSGIGSESHELNSLTSNSIVKAPSHLECRPLNFDRAFKKDKKPTNKDQSPSSMSGITDVLPYDNEPNGYRT